MVETREKHNQYQQRNFDEEVAFFKQSIDADIRQRLQAIVAAAELGKGNEVLDVGTGTGVLIPYITPYQVGSILGCDLSSAMLEEAVRRHPAASFWCGDIIDMPASFGSFDVIFFNAMFGNVWNQRTVLKKSCELLKPHGKIIISHPMGARFVAGLSQQNPKLVPHLLPSAQRLKKLIEDLELNIIRFEDEQDFYLCVLKYTQTSSAGYHV